jgi:hypothetical protein
MNAQATRQVETGLTLSPQELAQANDLLQRLKAAGALAPDGTVLPAGNASAAGSTKRNRSRRSEPVSATATAATSQPRNVPSLDDLLKDVTEIATTQGRAADGLTHLYLKVAEGAFLGAIDRQKDKHGPGISDKVKICETYVKARTGATMFDTKPVKARKFMSTVDTMTRLGMFTKGGPGEPLSTLNAVVTLHRNLRKDPTQVGNLIDLPNAILKFAREQIKRDQMITESEYKRFLVKTPRELGTIEDWWDHLRKQAEAQGW